MHDLTTSHAVEIVRRSIAMLAPGQPALWREDAVRLLAALRDALAALEEQDGSG